MYLQAPRSVVRQAHHKLHKMFKFLVALSVLLSLNYCATNESDNEVRGDVGNPLKSNGETVSSFLYDDEQIRGLQHQVELINSALENLKLRLETLNVRFDHQTTLLNEMNRKLCTIEDNIRHSPESGENLIDIRSGQDSFSSKIAMSQKIPRNCYEAHAAKYKSGLQAIHLTNFIPSVVVVYCDNDQQGGGWTVIQRRKDGSVDFYRDWAEYKNGFGHLEGEFWIGLDKLHALTTNSPQELLIVMEDFHNKRVFAKYDNFTIGNESEGYILKSLGAFTGDAGDSLTHHLSAKFSTKNVDNDIDNGYCAVTYVGAWWYKKCHVSNLNGKYLGGEYTQDKFAQGVVWHSFRGYNYSLKFVQMMIRPKTI